MIQHRLLKVSYRILMVAPIIGMVLGLAPKSVSAQQGSAANALVDGRCVDTGTTCTTNDDCEGTCVLAGTACLLDAECPRGMCSFDDAPCDVAADCARGTCSVTTAEPCDVNTDCPTGTCSRTGAVCNANADCPVVCPQTGNSICGGPPESCCRIDAVGRCNGRCKAQSCVGGETCVGGSQTCIGGGDSCDEGTNTCCGNGVLDPMEECDDLNIAGGDGCSSICDVEPGFVCTGQPSACGPDCNGNGIVDEQDIADLTSPDANGNMVPDECDLPGDFDGDGLLDLGDYALFQPCMEGPGVPVPPSCAMADTDFDAEADSDLLDFANVQRAFTGSGP